MAGALSPPPLFAPLKLGELHLPNRIVVESTVDAMTVRSGAGLVLTEPVAVTAQGRITPDTPTLDSVSEWTAIAARVHDSGALLGVRLSHAGRRGATRPASQGRDVPLPSGEAWPLLAASATPFGPFAQLPKAMDDADKATVREAFAAAAGRAARAGVDLLELDMADGYLLAGFRSPLASQPPDPAFPLSIVDAVRSVWTSALAVRLTVTDWARGGLEIDDAIAFARELRDRGVDLVHIRAGQTVTHTRPKYHRGYLTTLSDRVRNEAGVPTLVGGYLTRPDEVNTIVAAGRADLCLLDLEPSAVEAVVLG
ncbi:MAG: hypothetical protein M3548_04980 [Actinomycetota bacterium]|nr:hypothetical protein [Actinomycetota bacterium]